ncbi:MAG TPA: hypothetical protein PKN95_13795 [Verrucomicrobiota bacterium]|nr:hypothetical protein [Verrucomicrobiota bacterium]HNT15297.1 hypothetical protein [Verrucomicrobiota bacterium]
MNPGVSIATIPFFTDARGQVIEPIGEPEIHAQRNCHVALTVPGAIRGNHFHRHRTEIFVVIGPALVRLRENGVVREVTVPEGQAMRFTVPPLVSHAVQNTGPGPMLLMAFSTVPHDPSNPDTCRDILIEN